VLSLDTLRALAKGGTLEALGAELEQRCAAATDPGLAKPVEVARQAFKHAVAWISEAMAQPDRLEAGARRFALTLGRSLELALLADHAQWCLSNGHGPRTAAAARRFAQSPIDLIDERALEDTKLLA
jgi:acyl-CoA dehydrogenase